MAARCMQTCPKTALTLIHYEHTLTQIRSKGAQLLSLKEHHTSLGTGC